jgi:predicted Zn-dependent protease
MMKISIFLLSFVLTLPCQVTAAEKTDLQPKIQPGYQPVDAETEKGLWMELEEYEATIRRSALLIKDGPVNDYVKSAACRVAGDYCGDLRIYLIRNPGFNASMTANGVMQVWTGLLVRVSSEDELAAVLGHELAHYTQLHTLARFKKIRDSLSTASFLDLGLMVLTGIPVAVGQLSAIANAMAFSREQEEEADLLGVSFMSESGYDPRAAARVWKTIVAEEKSAVAKRQGTSLFSSTHPESEARIKTLESFVDENYPASASTPADSQSHVDILNRYYMLLMEDQIDTNRFGRTEHILKKHREIGVDPALIHFFQGEMYRQRNADGDLERARKSYQLAIETDKLFADAYRNLAYINLKQGNPELAREEFRRYLDLKPDADDRAMIEFYLQE